MKPLPKLRTLLLLLATIGTVLVVPAMSAATHNCPTFRASTVQPLDNGVLMVARVSGDTSGAADGWEIKIDAWLCNPTSSSLEVEDLRVEFFAGTQKYRTELYPSSDYVGETLTKPAFLEASHNAQLVHFRNEKTYPFPLATSVRLTFRATTNYEINEFSVTYPVAVHRNDQPLGSYFFPMRQSDLGPDQYWIQWRHAEHNNFQRWAYDLSLARWTGSGWSLYRDDEGSKTAVTNKLTYGVRVYAMGDGEIIACNRGAPDNNEGETNGNVPGGNVLWVRHGNETVLYAHLQQYSIPANLCPFSDDNEHRLADPFSDPPTDAPYRIKAGQFLGKTGSSGYSQSGPHLHIHALRGLPRIWGGSETGIDSDARPLNFVNARAQSRSPEMEVVESRWNPINGAIAPYFSAIKPNHCGFDPSLYAGDLQAVNLRVEAECFGDMYNAMVHIGMRPVSIDFTDEGLTNTVWRPNDGTPWLLFYGLDDAGITGVHNTYFHQQGFRYLDVEEYQYDGRLLHAVLMVKQPGPAQYLDVSQSASQLQANFNARIAAGYRPVTISATDTSGGTRFASLYELTDVGSSYVAKVGIPLSSAANEFNTQVAAGRHLAYSDTYDVGGVDYITMIFYSALDAAYFYWLGGDSVVTRDRIRTNEPGMLARRVTSYVSGSAWHFVTHVRGAPVTRFTETPGAHTSSTSATLRFAANDPLVTYECKLDAGAWSSCTSPRSYSGLAAGSHSFSVRARDRQGLREVSPAVHTWSIDRVAPNVDLLRPLPGKKYFYDIETSMPAGNSTVVTGSLTVRATATDSGSGIDTIRFRVDGVLVDQSKVTRDTANNTWSFVWSDAAPGTHTIEAIAYDRGGLTDVEARTVTVTVTRRLFF